MDPYLGMILLAGFNFAPRGYALAWGQILPIAQNTALFSIFGTTYGGNGQSTFGLPDLRGRGAVSQGQSPGYDDYALGELIGEESVTLLQSNMPAHNHLVNALAGLGDQATPNGFILAEGPKSGSGPTAKSSNFYTTNGPNTPLNPLTLSLVGSNIPISIMQPFLAVTAIVATSGVFPVRN